jgi:hypothetical protein
MKEEHNCIHEREIGEISEFKNNAKGKIEELYSRVDKLERVLTAIQKDLKFLKTIRKQEMLWIRGIGVGLGTLLIVFMVKTFIWHF